MDCAGLGTLTALRKFIRDQNGAVRLLNPTGSVLQLLDLLRAGSIFEIVRGLGSCANSELSQLEELPA